MVNNDNLARMSSVLKQLFLTLDRMNVKINTLIRYLHIGGGFAEFIYDRNLLVMAKAKTQLELSEDKFILCTGSMTYQVD
mgnify:CR=1 FL=1